MIELIGTVVTGIFSGGATGLLGVLLQRFFDWKKQQADLEVLRLNLENAEKLHRMDLEARERMAERDAVSRERLAEIDAAMREAELASADFEASHASDRATYLAPEAQKGRPVVIFMMALVDLLRGLIRPGATIYANALLFILLVWVRELYARAGAGVSAADVLELTKLVVGTIIYLATTCTVWWFGVRAAQRK